MRVNFRCPPAAAPGGSHTRAARRVSAADGGDAHPAVRAVLRRHRRCTGIVRECGAPGRVVRRPPAEREEHHSMISTELDNRFRAAAAEAGLLDVAYDVVDSPVGELFVAVSDRGLCTISYDT